MDNQQSIQTKHSGIGIAAFIISIILAGGLFLLVIIAGLMEASTPGGIDEESLSAAILGLLILGTGGFQIIALVLSLVGLFQQNRKKLFPVLGTVVSSLTLLGISGLMILGMITG
ncbi:hypothetical protein K8T06_01865 [bacterium]|nr:hypothetical protein [bacterium]